MASYINNLFGLEGRVAAITGGGGYLQGPWPAVWLRRMQYRCDGYPRRRQAEDVARQIVDQFNGKAVGIEVDATDKASFRAALNATLDAFGRADILINGAGINAPTPFLDIELEEFHEVMNSQITSTLLGCQVFGAHMLEQGKGSIINISSASAGAATFQGVHLFSGKGRDC